MPTFVFKVLQVKQNKEPGDRLYFQFLNVTVHIEFNVGTDVNTVQTKLV